MAGVRLAPISDLAGDKSPRHAASAPGAVLNYLGGVAASQMTIAFAAVGLDPGIGIFHADREGRASLAWDCVEAIRPYSEAWLLCCLAEGGCRFAKRDFYEEGDGTIRLTRPLSSWLALTAPLWLQAAEVIARWLFGVFEAAARGQRAGFDDEVIEAAETGDKLPAPGSARRHPLAGSGREPSIHAYLWGLVAPPTKVEKEEATHLESIDKTVQRILKNQRAHPSGINKIRR